MSLVRRFPGPHGRHTERLPNPKQRMPQVRHQGPDLPPLNVANPESPDGSQVLLFTSKHPAGHVGEIRVLDRTTGQEIVLAEDVHTEDAHRVACQQWLSGGKRVAFHEVVGKKWRVCVVDVSTREKVIVAENHQVGFGHPEGDLLPLYGCHWNPGPFRDLEIWDATT